MPGPTIMPPVGNSNMQFLPPFGLGQPGAPVQGGGGSGQSILAVNFRDPVDAARSMMGARVPSAEWPDGYLGTIRSRREDRLLDTVKRSLNQRAYQRGVHKGERIDPGDYFWPAEFAPESGLLRQADAVRDVSGSVQVFYVQRHTTTGTLRDRLTVLGQRLPRGAESLEMDPRAVGNLDRLRPAWG